MKKYLKANYHTHTTYCKHAWGTMREYIEAAIANGIQILGFSDHVPFPEDNGYVSDIRMSMQEAENYVADIRALQEEYKDQITIYIGFEAEYVPDYFDAQKEMLDRLQVDYMIMGQHFFHKEYEQDYTGTPTEDETRLKMYVDCVIEGMRTGTFAYLAHPDMINFVGDQDIYKREITRLCVALKEMGIPVELNVLGILKEKHYPSERFFEIVCEVGNDVIFGLDVHWVEQIGDMPSFEKAMQLAKKYDLNIIEKLDKLS